MRGENIFGAGDWSEYSALHSESFTVDRPAEVTELTRNLTNLEAYDATQVNLEWKHPRHVGGDHSNHVAYSLHTSTSGYS